ncbi:Putative anti-sigma factor antagonist [Streptomyces sp. YIM 121038]|uniref:STAS domain-containing protein n=1 Tax=unclassified Streptomyces TaxID=2593676 RepID=UPI001163CF8A|nr:MULTISPECIES: STAS domain-containing protein [unclassified Streptomyces]QCX74175.1 Putative anti-sigma factor antagonist [Streptomyces sp. YIM 121038]
MAAASPSSLRVDIVSGFDPALVRVHGDLDIASAPSLRAALAPLLHRRVELDLTDVAFIDSSGINALAAHHRHCRDAGGRITVIEASKPVRRVLHITGVDEVLVHRRDPEGPGGGRREDPPNTP